MTYLELSKTNIINQLRGLCAHCANNREHCCPVQEITQKVVSIQGVPLIVNNEFRGILWA